MKNLNIILILILLGVGLSSCKKDSSSTFKDGLTFGTSVNYLEFALVGEGSSFSTVPGNVAFRLESEEEFNNNPVKFVILKNGITYSTEIFSSNPVPTGHIFITTLNFGTAGQYSVTGYIQKPGGDLSVASATLQMN
jgi:hypothetical protein